MKKRIVQSLVLVLYVVSAFGLGMTNIDKTTYDNIETEPIYSNEDYNLTAGVTRNIISTLETTQLGAAAVQITTEENRFEEYNIYTNCFVNIRKKDNINSEVVATIDPNILVRVIEETGDWCKITIDDIQGYIKSEYLSSDVTPVSKLNRWGIELTDNEVDLLALIVFGEAGNQKIIGKEAVVESIFNRMISEIFGGDLYSVLSKKGQYDAWEIRYEASPSEEEYEAIYNVLYGKTYILDYDYVYFSRRKVNGYDFIKIGDHWFSKGKIYE